MQSSEGAGFPVEREAALVHAPVHAKPRKFVNRKKSSEPTPFVFQGLYLDSVHACDLQWPEKHRCPRPVLSSADGTTDEACSLPRPELGDFSASGSKPARKRLRAVPRRAQMARRWDPYAWDHSSLFERVSVYREFQLVTSDLAIIQQRRSLGRGTIADQAFPANDSRRPPAVGLQLHTALAKRRTGTGRPVLQYVPLGRPHRQMGGAESCAEWPTQSRNEPPWVGSRGRRKCGARAVRRETGRMERKI